MAGKRPVAALRERLSPEARARAARRTKVLLKQADFAVQRSESGGGGLKARGPRQISRPA